MLSDFSAPTICKTIINLLGNSKYILKGNNIVRFKCYKQAPQNLTCFLYSNVTPKNVTSHLKMNFGIQDTHTKP